MLRLVGGDRALAEDLTQEVFLRVYQGLPKFSLRWKFTTWLFQVTKNRVLDELRALERRPRALVAIDDIAPLEVLDAPIERIEEIDALWRAVKNLSIDLKMALLLRDVVGLSYTEIADSLEVTLATVKWRIYKAREEVQIALVREGVSFGAAEAAGYGRRSSSPQPGRDVLRLLLRVRSARASAARRCRGSAAASSRRRACASTTAEHERGEIEQAASGGARARWRRRAGGGDAAVVQRQPSGSSSAPSSRAKRGRRGRPVVRVARERAHDGVLDAARHARRELADGRDLARRLLGREVGERVELVRRPPGEQLVEHGAERVDVGGRRHLLAERLLRREVGGRAEHRARPG